MRSNVMSELSFHLRDNATSTKIIKKISTFDIREDAVSIQDLKAILFYRQLFSFITWNKTIIKFIAKIPNPTQSKGLWPIINI